MIEYTPGITIERVTSGFFRLSGDSMMYDRRLTDTTNGNVAHVRHNDNGQLAVYSKDGVLVTTKTYKTLCKPSVNPLASPQRCC